MQRYLTEHFRGERKIEIAKNHIALQLNGASPRYDHFRGVNPNLTRAQRRVKELAGYSASSSQLILRKNDDNT